MNYIASFSAIAKPNATTLILGSIPGAASLRAGQYYAHPQNQFWKIICQLTGIPADTDYENRIKAITDIGFALWDVVKTCERQGSMDSQIINTTIIVNDFAKFFQSHTNLRRVFFNGGTAEMTFQKRVLPYVGNFALSYQRLPSTSPAYASRSFEQKLAAWHQLLE